MFLMLLLAISRAFAPKAGAPRRRLQRIHQGISEERGLGYTFSNWVSLLEVALALQRCLGNSPSPRPPALTSRNRRAGREEAFTTLSSTQGQHRRKSEIYLPNLQRRPGSSP